VLTDAATVNGEPISLSEFNEHMGLKETAQVMTERGASELRVLGNFGLQSIQELVDQKVLMQMAKDDGVLPTESDIDAELNFQTSLRPTYLNMLQDQGFTTEMIRQDLKVGLAREHLIMKGITVDPADVDKYIKAHADKFTEPPKASLLYIQAGSEAKQTRVDFSLKSGKPFGAVASEQSEAPNARQYGGAYPVEVVSQMPKPVQVAVMKTAEKGTTAWLPAGKSFVKFYVIKKTPARVVTPTSSQRELVKRGIALERGRAKNDFDKRFFEKLKSSKIEVSVPYLKESWTRTWNQLSQSGLPQPNSSK